MRTAPFALLAVALALGCKTEREVPFRELDAGGNFDEEPYDSGFVPIDRPLPIDRGTTPPTDLPIDRGASPDVGRDAGSVPMCPATCATSADCDPCWGDSMRIGQYCCQSSLCIYRGAGETCDMTTMPGGGGGDGGLGDGASGDLGAGGGDGGAGTCHTDADCTGGECCANFGAVGLCLDPDLGLCK